MGKHYVIHEPDVHIQVGYNIDNLVAEEHYITPTRMGELFIADGSIYLGMKNNWYRIAISEISIVKPVINEKKIQIICDDYRVTLYSDQQSHLFALKNILCIVKHRIAS